MYKIFTIFSLLQGKVQDKNKRYCPDLYPLTLALSPAIGGEGISGENRGEGKYLPFLAV